MTEALESYRLGMEEADPEAWKPKKKKWDKYSLQRRALVSLRRDIHNKPLGKVVKDVRKVCDVLLRG